MEKESFLIEDFKNIQELIRFNDQKAAAILVVCGIILTVFIEVSKKLTFASIEALKISEDLAIGVTTFVFGIMFCVTIVLILYQCIFNILKPKFANHYTNGDTSILYFEHIANRTKADFKTEIENVDDDSIIENLTDQIYETSKILLSKSKACALIMNLVFANILILLFYIFFSSLL